MAVRTAMNSVLTKCGFSVTDQRTYLIDVKGLNCWTTFATIDFSDFGDIAKQTAQHTVPFTIGVVKIIALKALKFWIEDKGRMDEVRRHGSFTTAVLNEYIQLYTVISDTSTNSVEFVVRTKLDPMDWDTFANGTEEWLGILLGNGGVPLSYMIRDNTLRPDIDPSTTSRPVKLHWNAKFTGPSF